MSTIDNLVLHICLPQGLALVNGATLMQNTTLDVVTTLSPFYAGVGQVKLAGGYFNDGMTSALVNPTTTNESIETLIRQ